MILKASMLLLSLRNNYHVHLHHRRGGKGKIRESWHQKKFCVAYNVEVFSMCIRCVYHDEVYYHTFPLTYFRSCIFEDTLIYLDCVLFLGPYIKTHMYIPGLGQQWVPKASKDDDLLGELDKPHVGEQEWEYIHIYIYIVHIFVYMHSLHLTMCALHHMYKQHDEEWKDPSSEEHHCVLSGSSRGEGVGHTDMSNVAQYMCCSWKCGVLYLY